jgi:hypothetical protein
VRVSGETVFHSKALYWSTLLFAVGFGGYCLVYGFLVAIGLADVAHSSTSGVARPLNGLVFFGFAGFAYLIWSRLGRARMIVSDTTVVVVNPIKRYVMQRDHVARITTTSANGWAVLVTVDGQRIPVIALSTGLRWTLKRRLAVVAARLGIEFR